MLLWLAVVFAALVMALLVCAGCVAMFVRDPAQRADAYKVLKLLTTLIAGSGTGSGLVVGALKLHELGVF